MNIQLSKSAILEIPMICLIITKCDPYLSDILIAHHIHAIASVLSVFLTNQYLHYVMVALLWLYQKSLVMAVNQ